MNALHHMTGVIQLHRQHLGRDKTFEVTWSVPNTSLSQAS